VARPGFIVAMLVQQHDRASTLTQGLSACPSVHAPNRATPVVVGWWDGGRPVRLARRLSVSELPFNGARVTRQRYGDS